MTNEQTILGIALFIIYAIAFGWVHYLDYKIKKGYKKLKSKTLEEFLPPKDKEQPYEAYELGKYTDWKDSNRPPES